MVFRRTWIILFSLSGIPLLFSGVSSLFVILSICLYLLLFLLAWIDWMRIPNPKYIEVDREVGEKLSLGTQNLVRLRIRNGSKMSVRLEVQDSPPLLIPTDMFERPIPFAIPSGTRYVSEYHLTPKERGDYTFGDIFLRTLGPLGLVSRIERYDKEQRVKVYPNLLDAAKFTIMARRGRLQQVGVRAARLQGVGREFESLRDYQPDDEMRRIDWKATARRGKLVSRQYEVERSQSIILVLDVGRTMLAEIDGVQKLEYAINASLLLAFVATLTEDKVGLLLFSDEVKAYIPPKKGRSQVYAIMDALYNARASYVEPDYRKAFSYLQARWRKRSLVICFTDLWDADSSRTTIQELASLQPRHLVAAVTLLDTNLNRMAQADVTDAGSVFRKAVATQTLDDRQHAMSYLSERGVLVVDSPAEKLSAELVNNYLRVKERMLL